MCAKGKKKMLNFKEEKNHFEFLAVADLFCLLFIVLVSPSAPFFWGFYSEPPGLHWLYHFTRDILAMLLIENPFGIASGESKKKT